MFAKEMHIYEIVVKKAPVNCCRCPFLAAERGGHFPAYCLAGASESSIGFPAVKPADCPIKVGVKLE